MLIIPAIDIRAGSCVRLVRGDPNQATVYSSDPMEMARLWVEKGAKRLHIVDLDGAFTGQPHHLDLAIRIKKELNCEIQFGGGLREKEVVKKALSMGIDRLILGTAALNSVSWVKSALDWFEERFMVAIDALNQTVTMEGWQADTNLSIKQALAEMESIGFKEIIFTDINRDGTLTGPNIESIRNVVVSTRMGVYASGGIASMADLENLKAIPGLKGAIVGKALYSGKIQLEKCYLK